MVDDRHEAWLRNEALLQLAEERRRAEEASKRQALERCATQALMNWGSQMGLAFAVPAWEKSAQGVLAVQVQVGDRTFRAGYVDQQSPLVSYRALNVFVHTVGGYRPANTLDEYRRSLLEEEPELRQVERLRAQYPTPLRRHEGWDGRRFWTWRRCLALAVVVTLGGSAAWAWNFGYRSVVENGICVFVMLSMLGALVIGSGSSEESGG